MREPSVSLSSQQIDTLWREQSPQAMDACVNRLGLRATARIDPLMNTNEGYDMFLDMNDFDAPQCESIQLFNVPCPA